MTELPMAVRLQLNAMSDDLLRVERELSQLKAPPSTYCYHSEQGDNVTIEREIAWEKFYKENRHRLMYRELCVDNTSGAITETMYRPIIETKVATRIEAHACLHHLINAICKAQMIISN